MANKLQAEFTMHLLASSFELRISLLIPKVLEIRDFKPWLGGGGVDVELMYYETLRFENIPQ